MSEKDDRPPSEPDPAGSMPLEAEDEETVVERAWRRAASMGPAMARPDTSSDASAKISAATKPACPSSTQKCADFPRELRSWATWPTICLALRRYSRGTCRR